MLSSVITQGFRPTRLKTRALTTLFIVGALVAGVVLPQSVAEASGSVWHVETSGRSEAEVAAVWQGLKPSHTGGEFVVAPSTTAPYAPGTVQPGYLADGLNTLNFARYLAGLPYDVTLDPDLVQTAQHGAVLLAASNFSHNPAKPADMTQAFYDRAIESTSKSNIGSGHQDIPHFQTACLHDSSSASNLLRVGHRRWLLHPPMKYTGIGYAGKRYTTYALDRSRTEKVDYTAIAWPSAGVFPVEFFDSKTPWSITVNPERYDWSTSGHTVTLERLGDGRVWSFDASMTDTTKQYFNADFSWMGVNNVFVFRPDPATVAYKPGEQYRVTLSGGIRHKGTSTPATISYTTRFFSLDNPATPEPASAVLQHDSGGVTFDRWVTGHSAAYSGGGYVYSRWAGTELRARFTGSRISWIGPKQPSYGIAEIYLNGAYVGTVDQYASEANKTTSALIWESGELPEGQHTLTIKLTGEKNPAASGTVVVVDRFEVSGVGAGCTDRLCEKDTTLSGSWVTATNPTYYDQTYAYSRWSGSKATLTFSGTRVAWVGPMTPHYGRADVYIDGVKVATVDQYRPGLAAQGWREVVWDSGPLTPGVHTLEIWPTGAKHPDSTAANVVIDAFDVME